MLDLDLFELRVVDVLASTGDLKAAAVRLGVGQRDVNNALAKLRKEVADPLFFHTPGGLRPTPYGNKLAKSVRNALRQLLSGLNRPTSFDPRHSLREFNVFMSSVGQIEYLPDLVQRLALEAPGVTLRVRTIPEEAPHVMLESGDVDLAIGTFTTLLGGFRQKRLFRERHVCVVRRDHPDFTNGMSVEAFRRVPHAVAEQAGYVHELLDRWLTRQKMRRVVKLEVPYFLALPAVIAHSDLLGVMASRLAQIYAAILPLKIMPLPARAPTYDIKLFWHERFDNDPANRWVRDLFIELFAETGK